MAGITEAGSSTSRIDVLLTHLHSDHTGLAREAAAPDGRIYISETDFKVLQEGFLPREACSVTASFWRPVFLRNC